MNACLNNLVYDSQCEGHRAFWLYEMFKSEPLYANFSESIVTALRSGSDDYHVEQVCDLAGLMGRNGDSKAASALREFVWAQPLCDGGLYGGHAIVSLDGVSAAVEIARRLGRGVLAEPNGYVDSLDYLIEGNLIFDETLVELKRQAVGDPAIAAYVAQEQQRLDERIARDLDTPEKNAARMGKVS